MHRLSDLPLEASDLSLMRKIFEIGTEQVMLQTVISADGDITTHIAKRLVNHHNEVLLQMHNDSVARSVSFWGGLVSTLSTMAKSLLGGSSGLFK